MRVIVTNKCQKDHPPRGVRKCPPNYKPKESEWILEVDDYTEEDIKEYFEKPGIEWRGWKKKKKGHVK